MTFQIGDRVQRVRDTTEMGDDSYMNQPGTVVEIKKSALHEDLLRVRTDHDARVHSFYPNEVEKL